MWGRLSSSQKRKSQLKEHDHNTIQRFFMNTKETIAAIATGTGAGGLGVIRISGERAKEIASRVFVPAKDRTSCDTACDFSFRPRYMHFGSFVLINEKGEKQLLDEILVVYFPNPHSYTGEDVAEIHAHGGAALLNTMLDHILSFGIRQAEAGEFTKRAFLNGRMDLSQAEAVAEIIAAPVQEGIRFASAKLHGQLGERITNLRNEIEYMRRRICLAIDFPEEEGELLPEEEFHNLNNKIIQNIKNLLSAYERAKPWREGSLVVLAGQVNAGKSSLMNALLGRQRAIVTAQAGTTRDYLEESSFLAGLPVRLTDTAGLREIAQILDESQSSSLDLVEQEGIRRSLELIERADLVLLVFNGAHLSSHFVVNAENATDKERQENNQKTAEVLFNIIQEELALIPSDVKRLYIWNKADIAMLDSEVKKLLEEKLNAQLLCLSARPNVEDKNHEVNLERGAEVSIDDFARIARAMLMQEERQNDEIAPNQRQAKLLNSALEELQALVYEIDILPPDLTAIRLESAAQYLSAITGLCTIDETFNAIFAEFCIGK